MDGVNIRCFRNADVPALVNLWNLAMGGRRCAYPLRVEALERLVLSKLYFDPQGLLVAEKDGLPVGLVHAGFGPNGSMDGLDRQAGVISMLMVAPGHRRRGIGTSLMRAAHRYLAAQAARVVYAGGMWPLIPFYVGLYGGSEMAGIPDSETAMHALVSKLGYQPIDEAVVLHRRLDGPTNVQDVRFRDHRRELQVEITSEFHDRTWWYRQVFGCLGGEQVYLVRRDTGAVVARAAYWDMTEYGGVYAGPATGLIGVFVEPDRRQRGIGKYLLSKVLDRLNELLVSLVEVQTMRYNTAALGLYTGMGFREVGRGIAYRCTRLV